MTIPHDQDMMLKRRRFILGASAGLGAALLPGLALGTGNPAPRLPAPAEPPIPADPMDFWKGLWLQQDSGGVMEFRPDGRILGIPIGGSFKLVAPDWIHLTSGTDVLECRWKN